MLTSIRIEKTKREMSILFIFFLSFLFIKYKKKTRQCKWMLNIPNDCSADEDRSYLFWASCELLLVSYDLKTVSKTLRMHMSIISRISCKENFEAVCYTNHAVMVKSSIVSNHSNWFVCGEIHGLLSFLELNDILYI